MIVLYFIGSSAMLISFCAVVVSRHLFDDDEQDQAIQACSHPETYLKQLTSSVNCETTVIACRTCGKHITKPKTDCT